MKNGHYKDGKYYNIYEHDWKKHDGEEQWCIYSESEKYEEWICCELGLFDYIRNEFEVKRFNKKEDPKEFEIAKKQMTERWKNQFNMDDEEIKECRENEEKKTIVKIVVPCNLRGTNCYYKEDWIYYEEPLDDIDEEEWIEIAREYLAAITIQEYEEAREPDRDTIYEF